MFRSIVSKFLGIRRQQPVVDKMNYLQLDEKFYQQIVRLYEKNNSIIIKKVEKEPACAKGNNYVSQVSRVKISGTKLCKNDHRRNEEYQRSLIVKELPPREQNQLYRSYIAMNNEFQAYTKVMPALKRHANGSLSIADCIYANGDVIILKDLCQEGYESVEREKGELTIEQCQIVLEDLAKFHAASFVLKQKEPDTFKHLTQLTKEILFHGGDSPLLDSQTNCIQSAIDMFQKLPTSTENVKAIHVLQNLKQSSRLLIKQLLLNPREYSVICHGDLWLVNIMFTNKNELKLVDLQLMRYNSIASDLSYLLYVNLLPKIRVKNLDRLLDIYLNSLRANVKVKGLHLDKVLTRAWLNEEMQVFSLYGLVYAMWIMPAFFVKQEDVNISEENIRKTPDVVKKAGPSYENRLRDLVLSYTTNIP